MTDPGLRPAVRGLMIDPHDRVLLANLRFDDGFDGWVLPGGGMEDGEDQRQALIRELTEETGAPEVFVGPTLWHRTSMFGDNARGPWSGQFNTTFLVPCHEFEPAPAMSAEELAAEGMVGVRWWTVAEIAEAEQANSHTIKPEGLAELVERVLEHGAPAEPWDLGTFEGTRRIS